MDKKCGDENFGDKKKKNSPRRHEFHQFQSDQ